MTFLASDALEGRATGSPGHETAARYVADRMRSIGLEPAGTDGWFQPFVLRQSTSLVRGATAVIEGSTGRIELRPGIDFVALPSHLATTTTVEAPMAFVGFGVSAPEFGHDDLAATDVAGKVAVVIDAVPRTVPAELRDYYAKQRALQIATRGAVGVVYLEMPALAAQRSWERTVATRSVSYRLLDSEGRPDDVHEGLEAGIALAPAAVARLFDDAPKTLDRIWADAEAGRVQGFDLPGSLAISTLSVHRSISTLNVVGTLEGSSARLGRQHVVLLAHLDHVGTGAPIDGDGIYNGALDNASGVAVMLETARMLASADPAPRRSILFIATAGEERGLLGSRHFATYPTAPSESLVAAVNIDMPVALYPAGGFTAVGAEYSTLGAVARRALAAEGMRMVPSQHPERGLFTYTDQYSFVREGTPALYIHDAPLSADASIDAQAVFDEYLSRHYHQVSDDIALPIHWPTLATLARINARVCLDVANAGTRPRWLPGSFFSRRSR